MEVRKALLLLTVAVTAGFLCGCAGRQTMVLSNDRLSNIRTISIDKSIPKPKTVGMARGGVGIGGVGLLGAVVANVATTDFRNDRPATMAELLERNGIDVSQIVHAEAAAQLSAKKGLLISETPGTDATFQFTINNFCFGKTHPFGSVYDVCMDVTGKAFSKNGELIWTKSDYVSGLTPGNDQGQTEDTYYTDPGKLRIAIETATRVLLKELMATIGNN